MEKRKKRKSKTSKQQRLMGAFVHECDLQLLISQYVILSKSRPSHAFVHCFSSYKPSLRERCIYFYQLIYFMWNRTSQLKMPCAERALQNRSSVKTYCTLTYKQMEWAGVFDNNFYTVFCLKFWKSLCCIGLFLFLMSKSQSDRTGMWWKEAALACLSVPLACQAFAKQW